MAKKKRKREIEEFTPTSDIDGMLRDLDRAAGLSRDEQTEYWVMLCRSFGGVRICGSDWFFKAWQAEIAFQHRRLCDEFVICHGDGRSELEPRILM